MADILGRKGSTAQSIALIAIVFAVPLSILWLVPSLQYLHPVLAVVAMFTSATVILWPLAALTGLLALARSRRPINLVVALTALTGLGLQTMQAWPLLSIDRVTDPPLLVTAVIHARQPADIIRAEQLVAARKVQVAIFVDLTEDTKQALTASSFATTMPQHIDKDTTALHSSLPLSEISTTPDAPLLVRTKVLDVPLIIAAVDIPTPLDDPKSWRTKSDSMAETVMPLRSAPLVVIGSFGTPRLGAPLLHMTNSGFTDARSYVSHLITSSWPIGGQIRPILALDHAYLNGGVKATDYSRIAYSNDDYLGFVVTLTRPKN